MTSAGWPSLPLKRVVDSVQSGTSVNGAPWPAQDDQVGVLKTSAVYGGVFTPTENKEVESYDLDRVSCPVLAGSLIVSRMNTQQHLGVAAAVRQDFPNLYLPDRLWAVTFSGAEPCFIDWWTKTAAYRAHVEAVSVGTSSSMQNISQGDFLDIRIELPDLKTQRAIAGYLGRETARIDTLIEEQQRLIEMLRERRWAIVERVVALLDWDTPLKAVAPLIQTGPFGSQLKSDEYEDGGIPVINPSHIIAGEVVPDPRIAVSAEKAAQLARHTLEEGDLVAARRGDLGRCAVIRPSAAGFLCGTGSALVRLDQTRVEPSFAAMVFSSRRNRDALSLASVGSTMDNLNSDIIGALRVPVPPPDEQRRLTKELKGATAKIDTLIAETERFVELARERRAAMITAAVTGQIDVREMA